MICNFHGKHARWDKKKQDEWLRSHKGIAVLLGTSMIKCGLEKGHDRGRAG